MPRLVSRHGNVPRVLAEDIGFYGKWMRDQAFERIGHLYPKIALSPGESERKANVIAWIWARTVVSPDPSWNKHVPLVRSWVLRKANGTKPVIWVEPVIDRSTRTVSYQIREGGRPPKGTVNRRGGRCVSTDTPIDFEYIREQGQSGLMGRELIAIVAEGDRSRVYLAPARQPQIPKPLWSPRVPLPVRTLGFRVQRYGMVEWADLFTDLQLVALSTFSDLLGEVRGMVEDDARAAELTDDGVRLRNAGSGVAAYADALITYLAFGFDRCAAMWANLARWNSTGQKLQHMFGRQAIPMVWDFAEANPFSEVSGSWLGQLSWVQKAVAASPALETGEVLQRDASARLGEVPLPVVCTDPPYYDNIPYSDLSDFFYVWLRRNLGEVWPEETATLLTPKVEELVANRYRAGSKQAAEKHFEQGMAAVLNRVASFQHPGFPATIFYAFKQQELKREGLAATGWETFLQGMVDAGLQVVATWPIRTEMPNRLVAMGTAALASSVVIVCRPRPESGPSATRREFLDALHAELPAAVRLLQDQAIAPVDMAQSAIGPGMKVFSRYGRVLETDGSLMRVRTALALINEMLEEVLSTEETEFDADTRWALVWYEQFGHDVGLFGDAEVLATAKNTSVAGVVQAGFAESRVGRVRLLTRGELDEDWDPLADRRLTVWEVALQLVVRLDVSEATAADLLQRVGGGMGDRARRLTYLLYQIADRRGWAEDAVAYNGLIRSWHDIARLAAVSDGPVAQTFDWE